MLYVAFTLNEQTYSQAFNIIILCTKYSLECIANLAVFSTEYITENKKKKKRNLPNIEGVFNRQNITPFSV